MITTTKTTNSKIVCKKVALHAVTVIAAAFIVSMTLNGVSAASALEQIHASREVSASVDRLWNIVAM